MREEEVLEFMDKPEFREKLADVLNDLIFLREVDPLPGGLDPRLESMIREEIDRYLRSDRKVA